MCRTASMSSCWRESRVREVPRDRQAAPGLLDCLGWTGSRDCRESQERLDLRATRELRAGMVMMAGQERKVGVETEACCPPCLEISPPPYWRDPPAPLERRDRSASWANQEFRANR